MNYVAIDPSLSCTAMVVNHNKYVYTTPTVAHTKKGELKRWFNLCENHAKIRIFNEPDDSSNHSEKELAKFNHYNEITSKIITDILKYVIPGEHITVAIEGYSYSSSAGPLIDLVTFGTLLRSKLINTFPDIQLKILTPSEVKLQAAMLTYPPIYKNKAKTKIEYRNNEGVAGGSFKKPDMYKVLVENTDLQNDSWVKFLAEHSEEQLSMKSISKPIEDINDSYILYQIITKPEPLH